MRNLVKTTNCERLNLQDIEIFFLAIKMVQKNPTKGAINRNRCLELFQAAQQKTKKLGQYLLLASLRTAVDYAQIFYEFFSNLESV